MIVAREHSPFLVACVRREKNRRPFLRESLRHSHFAVMWLVFSMDRNQTTDTMERNVVRLWAAVSLGGALRDIPKNGCGGD